MAEPFLGEIRAFSFDFVPRNWVRCQGQLMAINSYQALFSLLGTTYGGNGVQTFGLPDLRGRGPMHAALGYPLGAVGGSDTHTLTPPEMPAHSHAVTARGAATASSPAGAVWAESVTPAYADGPAVAMSTAAIGVAGANQAHENLPPVLSVTFAIAVTGIFPSRG